MVASVVSQPGRRGDLTADLILPAATPSQADLIAAPAATSAIRLFWILVTFSITTTSTIAFRFGASTTDIWTHALDVRAPVQIRFANGYYLPAGAKLVARAASVPVSNFAYVTAGYSIEPVTGNN